MDENTSNLFATVTAHIAREDERDAQRDELFARMDAALTKLSQEHAEMLRDWREQQDAKKRRRETWEKVRTSVLGWIVVAVLGWIVSIGVAAATKAGLVPGWWAGGSK